jgi:hypothetical protein
MSLRIVVGGDFRPDNTSLLTTSVSLRQDSFGYGTEIIVQGQANFAGALKILPDKGIWSKLLEASASRGIEVHVMEYGSFSGRFDRIEVFYEGGSQILPDGCSVATAEPQYEARQLSILVRVDRTGCVAPIDSNNAASDGSMTTAAIVCATVLPVLAICAAGLFVYKKRQNMKKQWSSVQERLIHQQKGNGAYSPPLAQPVASPSSRMAAWRHGQSNEVQLLNIRASLVPEENATL